MTDAENKTKKYCPLFSISKEIYFCKKENCAWWNKEDNRCIIFSIFLTLVDMNKE